MVDAGRTLIKGLVIMAVLGMLAMGCSAGGTALKDDGAAGLAKIKGIDVAEAEGKTTVLLSLDRPVTFTSVKISEPPMMVVDLAGVDLGDTAGRTEVAKDPVLYIDTSRDSVSTRIARLEIGLSRASVSTIAQNGSDIAIFFDKTAGETAAASGDTALTAPASGTEDVSDTDGLVHEGALSVSGMPSAPGIDGTARKDKPAPDAATASAGMPAGASEGKNTAAETTLPEATTVRNISFSKSGKTVSIVVEGDGAFTNHKAFMLGKDRLVLDIIGVGSLKDKDTVKVGGELVKQVRMASHSAPQEKVRVVLDLGRDVDYDVKPQGGGIVVAVAPRGTNVVASVNPAGAKTATPRPEADTAADKTAAGSVEKPSSSAPKVETAMSTGRKITVSVPPPATAKEEAPRIYVSQKDGTTMLSTAPEDAPAGVSRVIGSDKDVVVTETKVYTGGKISFDIQDAELDKVIKLLADVAGLNLIMNPADVQGRVTLKLANVPWDQALDILLKIYNLDKVIEGNVLRVAPKSKLAEERKIDLRAIAEQKRLMEEAEDLYTKTFKINFADASELEGKVTKILSKRGEATSNPRTNELIITDVKDKIMEAGDLIDILDKEVNQILIEARIVTVDIGYSQSLGVSWGLARNPDPLTGEQPAVGTASGSNSSLQFDSTSGQYELAVPTELGADVAGLVTGMTWLGVMDNVNLDLTISALENIDKAETLAAPKVLTLENKAAQITQGTTLYVQTTSAAGTKPEPLNANLSLTVTPRVTGDNYIIMDVNATNNTPSTPPPGSTAAIETQAVQTNVIVKDGETIVLGGIYIKTKSHGDAHVPWLGRIPILGWLFKETTDNENTSELLIFITPKMVKQQPIRT